MSQPAFRPHGSADVERNGPVLTVHMRGDWNAEMRKLAVQRMMEHIPSLNSAGPWGIVNYLHDTLVYSENIYADTRRDYAARPPESKLRAVAFVIGPDVEGARLLKSKFEFLLDGVIPSRVFADWALAEAWIQEQVAIH